MIETSDIRIGDQNYRITTLPAGLALSVFVRLTKACGPAIAELIGTTQDQKNTELLDMNISPALLTLLANVKEEDIMYLRDTFAPRTQVEISADQWVTLNKTTIDDRFAGNLMAFFEWLLACVKHNFPDFLGGLQRVMSAPKAAPTTKKTS